MAHATHIVGGELSYECLGFDAATQTGTYRITMKVYRDCNPNVTTDFDDPATIAIYAGSNQFTFNELSVPITTRSNIPCNTGNPCLTCPTNVCVEQALYITTVSLPYNAAGYTMVYQRCCRNATISNVANPNTYGGTYTIELTGDAQLSCNSSPVYTNFPPIAICRNQPLVFNHVATDADGDVLVYRLCSPLQGGTQNNPIPNPPTAPPYAAVPFANPYSVNQPLGPTAGLVLDPSTGQLTATPTALGQFVVGICVDEFRNGVLMSSTLRDFQFNVVNCIVAVVPTPRPDTSATVAGVIQGRSCDNSVNFSFTLPAGTNTNLIQGQRWTFSGTNPVFNLTSTAPAPTVVFPGPGLYNGRIVVNPGLTGCSDSTSFQVRIYPPRTAGFTMAIDSCNNAAPIVFTNTSQAFGTGNPMTYQWSRGSTQFSTAANPTNLPPNAGTYTYTLRATDANGCTATFSRTTDWYPAATPNFTAADVNGCTAHTTAFTNTSFPYIASYVSTWNFNNGNTALVGQSPPAQTFTTPGLYDVTLSITSPWGCPSQLTRPQYIDVYALPQANFNYTYDSCQFVPTQFNDLSLVGSTGSPIVTWNWNFGDGSPNSNLQNPSHQFPTTTGAAYTVVLTVTDANGCVHTRTRVVNYFPAPIIDVTVNGAEGCVPYTTGWQNNSYPLNGYVTDWNFGDGTPNSTAASPSHTYTTHGVFPVTLTITSPTGCIKIFRDTVIVHENPHSQFTYSFDTCAIAPVQYVNQSTRNTANDAITDWFWNFGDGTDTLFNTAVNPSYQFNNSGNFPVYLIVTDINGCRDSSAQTVAWFPEPVIDVDVVGREGCFGDTVVFQNNSYPINGYTTAWDFGDGTTSTLASPTHVFPTHGTYYVELVITSPNGFCQTQSIDTIIVHERPTANFSFVVDGCNFVPVVYTDLSTRNTANDALNAWDWNFGDGSPNGTAQNPSHTPLISNTLPVTLTVTDINGCTDDTTRNVYWAPEPVVDVDIIGQVGCLGDTVFFQNNSYPINGYTTAWNFGDNTTSLLASPNHRYATPGIYTVNLVITSPNGNCVKTFVDTIIVNGLPTAILSFGADSCVLGPVTFTDQSINATSPINNPLTNWNWSYGDGNGTTQQNSVYLYSAPGNYSVTLTVTDAAGCTDDTIRSLSWFPAPPISIIADDPDGCEAHTVNFTLNTGGFPVTGYTITWDFGDGSAPFVGLNPPAHTFQTDSIYTVSVGLTAPVPPFCTQFTTLPITVYNTPVPSFTYDYDVCALDGVNFTDASTSTNGVLTAWTWRFTDPSATSGLQNPVHQYDTIGNYNVTLIATDLRGCVDSITLPVEYQPRPIYDVNLVGSQGCTPYTHTFDDNVYPIADYTTTWTFGDGTGSTDATPPPHTYNVTGNYPVTLVVNSTQGCVDTFTTTVVSLPLPVANFVWQPQQPSNLEPRVTFYDQSIDDANWRWTFGSFANSSLENPEITFPDTGIYAVTLIVRHPNGCPDTITRLVDVEPRFTYFLPNALTPNSDGINDGYAGAGILDKIATFNMKIFNRWGEQIFETTDPYQQWNGRKNNQGDLCQAGVYVVTVEIVGGRGERQTYKGFATIIY